MTIPRPTSATTLSSVWETIVPTTVGRLSRGRPVRRATISAREGSPRRAGRVADMSTPMNVPCRASERRRRASGSAAVRIACHATPRTTIEPHIRPEAEQDPGRRGAQQAVADLVQADALQREQGEERGGQAGEADAGLAGGRAAAVAALALGGLEAGQAPLGRPARPEIGRDGAEEHAGALARGGGPRHGDGVRRRRSRTSPATVGQA